MEAELKGVALLDKRLASSRLLVVEDEGIVAMDLRATLETSGMKVVATASSGEEAVEAVRRLRPDLVLMDITLKGGMDGIAAARRIHDAFDVPVVFVTAHSDQRTIERAKAATPYGFILKPFDKRELSIAVQMALYKHAACKAAELELQLALHTSEARMVEAQKLTGIGSWELDLASGVLFWSEQMFRVHGRDPGTFVPTSESFLEMVHVEDRDALRTLLSRALEKGAPFRGRYRLVRPGGEVRWIEGRGRLVRDRRGAPSHLAGIVIDVTAQRHAEEAEALRRQAELQRHFIADLSHEFRTPLAAISGFAETLALDGLKDRRTGLRFLRIIARHAEHLTRIVDDLLELAGHEVNPAPKASRVPLAGFCRTLVEELQPLADRKRVSLRCDVSSSAEVTADRHHLTRVLQNLLSNAIKYNRAGGSVTVSASCSALETVVSVRDTGRGIPASELPGLFQRFHRAHKKDGREPSTGLGLAICKSLVEAHGGKIWAESVPGRGSAFHFSLPSLKAGARAR